MARLNLSTVKNRIVSGCADNSLVQKYSSTFNKIQALSPSLGRVGHGFERLISSTSKAGTDLSEIEEFLGNKSMGRQRAHTLDSRAAPAASGAEKQPEEKFVATFENGEKEITIPNDNISAQNENRYLVGMADYALKHPSITSSRQLAATLDAIADTMHNEKDRVILNGRSCSRGTLEIAAHDLRLGKTISLFAAPELKTGRARAQTSFF